MSHGIFTLMICLAAVSSYINHKFLRWTPTIGIMFLSLVFSSVLIIFNSLFPSFSAPFTKIIAAIDFHDLLMNSMLGFLLFAGSVHIDAQTLHRQRWPVIILSTAGVVISTFIIGGLLFLLFGWFGLGIPFIYCLLFAALISPTDPVAVLAILRRSGIPEPLEMKIAGESLFNDGVAVVVFVTILEVAQGGAGNFSFTNTMLLFLREAFGGLLFGLLLGHLGYLAIRSVEKFEVEVLISIALVMGGYFLAGMIQISGPLAMVVAGIYIGSKSRAHGVSELSKNYLNKFWELVDELLNAILFLLIGFEMLVVKFSTTLFIIGVITILIVLLARWISVAIPVSLLRLRMKFEKNAIAILTWGGIRGGLSVALALSLPAEMHRDEFVSITYIIVIFSIIVQGLTIGKLYRRLEHK
jgi:monovalent cation:H+ antiporter, CPA1 family